MTDRLPARRLVAYGLLGLPLAALNLPLYVYLPTLYVDQVGLGLATVGTILLLARLLDTLTDPLIGVISDRLRSRFGRRRPLIALACPLLILATIMTFRPAADADAGYLLLWSSLAYLAWTVMLLPYTAWGAELADDYHERTRITAVREAFVVVGIILAAALPALLGGAGVAEDGRTAAVENALAVLAYGVAFILPLSVLSLLLLVPEPRAQGEPPLGFMAALRMAWQNRPFIRLIAAYLLNGIANGLPATLFLLFTSHVIGSDDAAGPLLLLYFAAGIVGMPLWLLLSRRFGKHRVWAGSMVWASAMFAAAPFLGEGDVWPFALICLLSGLSLGADLALPASIQADVVDLDRVASGRRRTGLFFAFWSMATKLALALAVGIAFPLLDLAGFSAEGGNDGTALLGLALLYGALPIPFKLAATLLIWRFPVEQTRQEALRRELEAAKAG
jgi:Na+/melibiose symporter-like transporter